jgi:hypothetical protein
MWVKKTVVVENRDSIGHAKYWAEVEKENGELVECTTAYFQNERRFMAALRRASGFTGKGLTTRGEYYGRDCGSSMSVHGKFHVRTTDDVFEKPNNLAR